jgi:uncharacterized protein (DUF1778 family)
MDTQQIALEAKPAKRERLEFRINSRSKILLQRAAVIQGRSLSDFLATTAEKAANEIIYENQIIQLSVEDSLAFAKAVFNSPKPNSKLQSAYKRYKQNVSSK